MPEIIPAILTDNKKLFKRQIQQTAEFGAQTVQIDFTDGEFVDSKTLLPDDLDSFVLSQSPLVLEAHLMTLKPEQYLSTLYALGFQRVAVHFKTLAEPSHTIELAKDYSVEIGLALNPETELDNVEPYIKDLDFILFLTVVPGEQGHKFEAQVLDKILAFGEKFPEVLIEVDGGIKSDNIQRIITTGADRIVVGSGIWRSGNPSAAFAQLQNLANS